jgi:hypothetical protein
MDLKIHEYPLERLSFGDDDFYDIDFWDGSEYKTAKILGSVIKSGILSGIAISLTAPSAFIVGGSPVDGSGTLTLTGAGLANQYIRGDGTLATFPTSGGGGNSVNYYLNGGTASSVATYFQMSKNPVIGTGVDFSRDGNGLISQWLTDLNEPNVTEIPAGNWNFEMYFSASSAGGVPKFYIEILKYNGTTFTTIANNSAVTESITGGTTIDLYLTSVAVPLTPLLVTDRIAIRVYIVDSTAGRTIIHHTQNSHVCQIITSFSSGISSINGLTKQTQYLAVGTAGSDFAINSATDTHTFNLPTASASRRGALSSADWTIFNNKQDLLVSTTNIKTINGTSILGSGNLVVGASSGVFGISNASGVYTYYATLTLAMASAVSGQVIEMFADVVETGSVEITLKNGVNINGNGHSYTLNNSGLIHAFKTTTSVETSCNILNLNVIRTGSTASGNDNSVLYFDVSTSGKIKCSGTEFINNGSGRGILFRDNCTNYLSGAIARSSNTAIVINSTNGAELINCIGYGIGSANGISMNGSNAKFCVGYSDSGIGFAVSNVNSNVFHCIGNSVSGDGLSGSGNIVNCIGKSTTGSGFYNTGLSSKNCTGISVSGVGIRNGDGAIIYNSFGQSSSNNGATNGSSGTIIGGIYESSLSYCIRSGSSSKLKNIFIICLWNNSSGYGVGGNAGICIELIQCIFNLSNSSAPYLYNGVTAQAISMTGNTYQGGGAFNVNLTQAITNVQDTKGNIYL